MNTDKLIMLLFSGRRNARLVLLTFAVALTTAMAASPALAQVEQETEQEGESGEVNQSGKITGSGDNSNQCVGVQEVANTGNAQNVTDINQYQSRVDEIEIEDSDANIEVNPKNSTECEQAVNQAATATAPEAAAPAAAPKAAPAPGAKPGAPAPAPGAKPGAPAPGAKPGGAGGGAAGGGAAKAKAKAGQLPKTGGTGGTVIALAAGALLIGGGLVAIRSSRFFRR